MTEIAARGGKTLAQLRAMEGDNMDRLILKYRNQTATLTYPSGKLANDGRKDD